jgi:hypothetical protein
VVVGLTTDAWAQCSSARIFRSSGKFGNNANIGVAGTDNTTNQIGRFWDSDNATLSNNGLAGPNFGNLCDINGANSAWWPIINTERKIDGALTNLGCVQAGCPANKMTVVVEDYAAGGPPGINDTAFYTGWMVDETPVSGRWYDYGNVDGISSLTIIPMLAFPDLIITGSSRAGTTIQINYNNLDQTNMMHSTDHAGGGGVYPTVDVVREWQLVKATGTSDPGRLRTNGWITLQSTPYVPGGAPDSFVVPCSSTVTDEFVAVGIGFNGGVGGSIDSALVGRAIPLECDPILAQPDGPVDVGSKPSATDLNSKPGRSGGRR